MAENSGITRIMKEWQKVEEESAASAGKLMEQADNPVIRLAMDVIRRDSEMHRTVQDWIAENPEGGEMSLAEDVGRLWLELEHHVRMEKVMAARTAEALESPEASRRVGVRFLLTYLLEDEKKHTRLLDDLENIKRGLNPYG